MPRHAETRQLPYSPEQMFDLVADVARYGEFLPWVAAVRVRSDDAHEMVADLVVGFKGISERFTSKVHKERPSRIHVDYLEGPLQHLTNDWSFRPDGQGGTLVDFSIEFEFKSRIFEMIADLMVGFKSLREKFTSQVTKQRPASIHVDYLDGPLKYLRNDWKFAENGQGGTLVDFSIEFEFKSRLFEMVAGQVFDRALRMMIGAFEERAARLYASPVKVAPGIRSSSAHSAA